MKPSYPTTFLFIFSIFGILSINPVIYGQPQLLQEKDTISEASSINPSITSSPTSQIGITTTKPTIIASTQTPTPVVTPSRKNISSKLYISENSSRDNLGDPVYPEYTYFKNDNYGDIYHYKNEEWVISTIWTCILPVNDENCEVGREDTLYVYYLQIWKGRDLVYTDNINYSEKVHILYRYKDHWIFSYGDDWNNKGKIILDGKIINDEYGYDTTFSLFLLNDKPFFFFKRGEQYGISYNFEEVQLPYSNIIYDPVCCEYGGSLNPRASKNKVGFYISIDDDTSQYIEIGLRN
jgi:hypothetical protein